MKNITIITEQVSDRALTAALPGRGIASVAVSRGPGLPPEDSAVESHQALRNPRRFRPNFRIDLIVEESAVESVFDGLSVAYGAGLFGDAEMWVSRSVVSAAA